MQAPSALPMSVAIITLNEAESLPLCLGSVRALASEIVVIDSGSTDQTLELARQSGVLVEHRDWTGFISQKNAALQRCSQPWVLCLDGDEVVSEELAASIREALADPSPDTAGFVMNRRTWYLGKWINHSWQPEWRLRLVRNGRATWTGLDPHDTLQVDGKTIRLRGDILHYSFKDLHDHFQRVIKYSRMMAESYSRQGGRFHWYHLLLSPWLAFLKRIIIKQAWRDGWRGWIIAFMSMFGTFAKYAFLLERELDGSSRR